MLYLHEVHAVIGEHETTFEDLARHAYLTVLPEDPEARLLWYLEATHGAGEGYTVVTVTAFADDTAFERYLDRVLSGDLADWMRQSDELRYGSVGTLLIDAGTAHVGHAPLAQVPVEAADHPRSILRQDTLWPSAEDAALLDEIRERATRPRQDGDILGIEQAFVPALGIATDGFVLTLQRVLDVDAWTSRWASGVRDWPGAIGPLSTSGRRQTRLLRATDWSPLY